MIGLGLGLGIDRVRKTSSGAITSVTDNFNYAPGTSLAAIPGYTVKFESFITFGGDRLYSTGGGGQISVAIYRPAGFAPVANHKVFGTAINGGGSGQAQGIACCIQPDGSCYILYLDGAGVDATLYFGYCDAAGVISDFLPGHPIFGAGSVILRLQPTGVGVTRVVTADYDAGGGFVSPGAAWVNRDFGVGKRLDNGDGGPSGYQTGNPQFLDSLTISNI